MINIERVYKTTLYIGLIFMVVMVGFDMQTKYELPWYSYLLPLGIPTVLFLTTIILALYVSHLMTKEDRL